MNRSLEAIVSHNLIALIASCCWGSKDLVVLVGFLINKVSNLDCTAPYLLHGMTYGRTPVDPYQQRYVVWVVFRFHECYGGVALDLKSCLYQINFIEVCLPTCTFWSFGWIMFNRRSFLVLLIILYTKSVVLKLPSVDIFLEYAYLSACFLVDEQVHQYLLLPFVPIVNLLTNIHLDQWVSWNW